MKTRPACSASRPRPCWRYSASTRKNDACPHQNALCTLERLRRQIGLTGDPALQTLFDELAAYPAPDPGTKLMARNDVVVPLRIDSAAGELTFFSTVTTFDTPVDITVEELMIESFFPADERTVEVLRTR